MLTGLFAGHYMICAAAIGMIFQSWLVFLAALIIMQSLIRIRVGQVATFTIMAASWLVLGMLIGSIIGGWPAAIVMGFLVFGVVYKVLQSGNEYFEDLRQKKVVDYVGSRKKGLESETEIIDYIAAFKIQNVVLGLTVTLFSPVPAFVKDEEP